MIPEPNCSIRRCKHFQGVKQINEQEETEVCYCKAFPKGIPKDIAYGKVQHLTKYRGQTGSFTFEAEESGS